MIKGMSDIASRRETMSHRRKQPRSRRKQKSKLVGLTEAIVIEGLAVVLMLVFFFGLRMDVRHQQKIKARWDLIQQQFESPRSETLFNPLVGAHTTSNTGWTNWIRPTFR
jgi:hypothetical protein